MQTYSVDTIVIEPWAQGDRQVVEYVRLAEDLWQRRVTNVIYLEDGTKEVRAEKAVFCCGDDVIKALLLATCDGKLTICVRKGELGTLIPVQARAPQAALDDKRFEGRIGHFFDNRLRVFVDIEDLELE